MTQRVDDQPRRALARPRRALGFAALPHGLSRQAAATVVVAAVAAATSFVGLGRQPLSWDEAVSANAADRSWLGLGHLLSHTDAPLSVYYAVLHLWVQLLVAVGIEPGAGWLRVPSALAATTAAVVLARLAMRLRGPGVGLLAGLLLAVNPLAVFYAHDARPYAVTMLAVTTATSVLVSHLQRPARWRAALYLALAILAVNLQLFALGGLAAHIVVAWRAGVPRRRIIAASAVVLAAAAPLAWLGHAQTSEIGWIPPDTPMRVFSMIVRVGGGAAPVVAFLLVGLAALGAWRPSRPTPAAQQARQVEPAVLAAYWALCPLVGVIAVSLVQPVLVPRYALVAAPGIALSAAMLVARVPRRIRVVAAAGLALSALIASGVQQVASFKYEDYRSAANEIIDRAQPGDGIVYSPTSARVGLDLYLHPDADDHDPVIPADLALADPNSLTQGDRIGGTEDPPSAMSAAIDRAGRVFLVGNPVRSLDTARSGTADAAKAGALAGYVVRWSRTYGAVTVTLLVPQAHNH